MLLYNFANLRLSEEVTSMKHATDLIRGTEVSEPASAFLSSLLIHCECPAGIINTTQLLIAYGTTTLELEAAQPDLALLIAASLEFTAVVQTVLEECGTAETSTFEPLSTATKLRFKAAVVAQNNAALTFRKSDLPVFCNKIEKALQAMYTKQAMQGTPASELTELAAHIERLRAQYECVAPAGLTRFDEARRM